MSRRKKRDRRRTNRKKGGMMIGMRGGFKKMAKTVAGTAEPKDDLIAKVRSSTWSTVIWVIVLLALLGFMIYRRS